MMESAVELAFRLALYRAMKETGSWLRERLDEVEREGRGWWACDSRPLRARVESPQTRMPL